MGKTRVSMAAAKKRKRILTVIGVVFAVAFLCFDYLYANRPLGERCQIHFVDVGQGDCTVFVAEDSTVVIDTGTGKASQRTLYYIERLTDSIDYLILTHPHEDHIGGAVDIIENINVENVIMTDAVSDTRVFSDLLYSIEKREVNVIEGIAGDSYEAGEIEFKILAPLLPFDNYNNYSMAVRVDFGNTSAIVTGDVEKESDRAMLEKWGSELDCDILKLAHHGSYTSTSKNFLETASPQWAVISCGEDNSYGHPHRETLSLLKSMNVSYVRTDEYGSIVFETNGKDIELKKSLEIDQ